MSGVLAHAEPDLVDVVVDGAAVRLVDGAILATALAGVGIRALRRSPRAGAPRGAFCFMGSCQECAIHIDGALRQACMTPVRRGMNIQLRGVP
jgi:D-hydroxyproline dehydrogenase subunit gamma